eukprot:TRINITY_DN22146_c0_g1_i1.p1 TRINITY_DN22146_c0_g1~~TRINITY_DN22146_c0_g1_i1.p1  ORF type:complete len:350 (-),score=78.38 TRINITY_DN22146_c0_g1_i1:312-1361(-)
MAAAANIEKIASDLVATAKRCPRKGEIAGAKGKVEPAEVKKAAERLKARCLEERADASPGIDAMLFAQYRLGEGEGLRDAERLLRKLEIAPSGTTAAVLIKGYGQLSDLKASERVWNDTTSGCGAEVACGCMISVLSRSRAGMRRADTMFDTYKKANGSSLPLYATLIAGHCKQKNWGDAIGRFKEMRREGLPRSVGLYNSILYACANSQNDSAAMELIEELGDRRDIVVSSRALRALLAALCKAHKVQEALRVKLELEARGRRCHASSYEDFLQCCADVKSSDLGVNLCQEMAQAGLPLTAKVRASALQLHIQSGYGFAEALRVVDGLFDTSSWTQGNEMEMSQGHWG